MFSIAEGRQAVEFARGTLTWAALSLGLNLLWEIAQLPLYVIPQRAGDASTVFAILHCTAGDVLIAVGSYLLASLVLRRPDWPSSRPVLGGAFATCAGLAYTVFSEWYNVYQAGTWAYSPRMPLLLGIGLSPLLQWIVIPIALLLILHARSAVTSSQEC